ncbi:SURF1 family protein [Rhizobiaceae bacterium LC148]|nr:cytochrome oxidase [Rhizobium sp. LC145]TKT58275.1 SURF1 family protein [Rhizobiaceae bacterium LC148]
MAVKDMANAKDGGASVPASRWKSVATVGVVILALAILLSLGTWQVQRLHWKERLLADIAERRTAPPVTVAEIEEIAKAGGDIEYRTVSVTGSFDHSRERHFFATHEGRTGFYVYTPMTLADGRVLFVNRGFVPYEMKEPSTRADGEVAGEVTLTGYARGRLSEKPSSLVPDNDTAKNIFYWKDLDLMTSSAGLGAGKVLPFFVDADASVKSPGGWPEGGVTQFDLPNNHLQYAVTWYGLAAALLAVVFGVWWKRRRSGGAEL